MFIALHGATGEDGALRAVLDLAGVPYVGSPAAACRLAWDKPAAKSVVRSAGVATPDWVALPHSTFRELGAGAVLDLIVARLGLPLMVKPAVGRLGAGRAEDQPRRGPARRDGQLLRLRRHRAWSSGSSTGVELALSVVDLGDGPEALPAVEIAPESGVFDYTSRYTPGLTEYHTPGPGRRRRRRARGRARRRGCTRCSAWPTCPAPTRSSTPDGEVHFLEVNVSPGLTETSMFPMAVEAAGYELGDVLARLLARAPAERSTGLVPSVTKRPVRGSGQALRDRVR